MRWTYHLLATALLVAGAVLLLLGYLGTFDTRSCTPAGPPLGPNAPEICFETPNLTPTFIGAALAVLGLAVVAWRFLHFPTGKRSRPPTSGAKEVAGSSEGKPATEDAPSKDEAPSSA